MKQPCWSSTTPLVFLLVIAGAFPFPAASASTSASTSTSTNNDNLDKEDYPNDSTTTHVRGLQHRTIPLTEVRTIDGTGNHPDNIGAVGSVLLRLAGVDYPESDPGGHTVFRQGPNPRQISNIVINQRNQSLPSRTGMTDTVWAWGQFIDHDISLTDANRAKNGAADIPVLDATDSLQPMIMFSRANHVNISNVRTPFNEITSFIDASMVYGSDTVRAAALRTFSGGRLNTTAGNLMPFNVDGLPNGGRGPDFYLGGDVRTNENVVLLSIHTLFVREHNRLAHLLEQRYRGADDESIYQMARKMVAAEIQIITFEEFLPTLLGRHAAPSLNQTKYDPNASPAVASEFSSALFRVGHTLLSSELMVGNDVVPETISLQNAFSKPEFIRNKPENVGRLLRGLSVQPCQEVDSMIVEDVRSFLFLPAPNPMGLDLAAMNMQRGREQGLPVYNRVRHAYGLDPVTQFSEISSDPIVQARLSEAYGGSVDAVDAWVGGISEDHLPGANVGPLISAAIVDQFTRLRDGDRFWHTADPDLSCDPWIAKQLGKVTFGRLIRLNTEEIGAPLSMFRMKKKRFSRD